MSRDAKQAETEVRSQVLLNPANTAPNNIRYPLAHTHLQGKLYLSGNGLSERSAVLDLKSGDALAAATPAEARGEMAGENGDGYSFSSPDVLVVERCCNFHNEQV